MTPISQMTEQELRVACAEAMGWTRHNMDKKDPFTCPRCGVHYSHSIWAEWEPRYLWCKKDGKDSPPGYPTDANAALTLVDALAEKGWDAFSVLRYKQGSFTVIFGKEPRTTSKGEGNTLQLAICRAFLKVHQSTL